MVEWFKVITSWYMDHISYSTITVFMAVESSFIPFPSEIVVPPAAWKAAQGELNIVLVIFAATFGAMIGAVFNYYFALILGRKMIYQFAEKRWAGLLLIKVKSIKKAEDYFRKCGRSSTFIGRLVPAVRQLISLPAGLAKMSMPPFLIFTALGSGLWNIILAVLGYFLYSQKEALAGYYSGISYVFIGIGIVFVLHVAAKTVIRAKKSGNQVPARTELRPAE